MTCQVNPPLAVLLSKMDDAQLIAYAESYTGLDGREMIIELALRLRMCKRKAFECESDRIAN